MVASETANKNQSYLKLADQYINPVLPRCASIVA